MNGRQPYLPGPVQRKDPPADQAETARREAVSHRSQNGRGRPALAGPTGPNPRSERPSGVSAASFSFHGETTQPSLTYLNSRSSAGRTDARQETATTLVASLQLWGSPAEPVLAAPDDDTPPQDAAWPPDADTVTMKNIPCRCRAPEILAAVEALGFGKESLVYFHLPLKQGKASCNLGCCFIGFRSPLIAREFFEKSLNFTFPSRQSTKVVRVAPARLQSQHLGRSFMHGEVLWFDAESRQCSAEIPLPKATGQQRPEPEINFSHRTLGYVPAPRGATSVHDKSHHRIWLNL